MTCENCGKEHDGSYGSGRFCSKSCKCAFNAKKNHWSKNETREWKCECCGLVFPTRRKLKEHQHETNHLLDNKHMVVKSENPICPFCGENRDYIDSIFKGHNYGISGGTCTTWYGRKDKFMHFSFKKLIPQ